MVVELVPAPDSIALNSSLKPFFLPSSFFLSMALSFPAFLACSSSYFLCSSVVSVTATARMFWFTWAKRIESMAADVAAILFLSGANSGFSARSGFFSAMSTRFVSAAL